VLEGGNEISAMGRVENHALLDERKIQIFDPSREVGGAEGSADEPLMKRICVLDLHNVRGRFYGGRASPTLKCAQERP
jgi:hypothetical protein